MSTPYSDPNFPGGNIILITPDDASFLGPWMTGTVISALVYGGVLLLSLSYVPLLLKTSNNISRRMQNFLLVYVTFMVTTSTIYIITISIALVRAIFSFQVDNKRVQTVLFDGFLCILFASWGAGGFMLWRCAMLYQGISRGRRITLIIVLVLMALASFGSGLAFIYINSRQFFALNIDLHDFQFIQPIIIMTVILNLITATLITSRILYSNRYIRKTVVLQRNSSSYTTILVICVESSALIVVFSLIYCIMSFRRLNASSIPMQALVHIYVISPLLIVHRLAQGKAVTITEKPSESRSVISELHFESQQALPLTHDEGV